MEKLLGKYVTPEALNSVLRAEGTVQQKLTRGRIEFVLAYVDGQTPEEVSERVGKVSEISASHHAVVHDLIGPLVVAAYGTHPNVPPNSASRISLVEHLKEALQSHVKIVHGAAEGCHGLIGSKNRLSYSFSLPRFDAMLGALSQLEFGKVREFES